MTTIILLTLAVLLGAFLVWSATRKDKTLPQIAEETQKKLLGQYVEFYQRLSETDKKEFENRVAAFLRKVRITGVKTKIADEDYVFVAAAAIIPIFAFKGWEYRNIREVLVYPGTFSADFRIEGQGRDVLGLVGNGSMENLMILSQQDLREGFLNNHTTSNTAIHEFVHLIDKADGSADGTPEALLSKKYIIPWLKRIHQEISLIRTGHSDINPYAATNEAEFLAVAAEYFFEQPHLMQARHPELYALLQQAFIPAAVSTAAGIANQSS